MITLAFWIPIFLIIIVSAGILKIIDLIRGKDEPQQIITYIQQPTQQTPPQTIIYEKEDLNDKIREEIRRQVELEVHQQLKDIRKRIEKDIEIGIIAYIHKQRARQARAQEAKNNTNK